MHILIKLWYLSLLLPDDTVVKNPSAKAGDLGEVGSIPGSGRSREAGNGTLLQYSFLENSMDREAWWSIVNEVVKIQMQLSTYTTNISYKSYIEINNKIGRNNWIKKKVQKEKNWNNKKAMRNIKKRIILLSLQSWLNERGLVQHLPISTRILKWYR